MNLPCEICLDNNTQDWLMSEEPHDELSHLSSRLAIMQAGFFTSALMLSLTLVIYLAVPHLRRNGFAWMKIHYLAALVINYSLMCAMMFGGMTLILDHPLLCTAMGYLCHYFFLASFFWLNAMSFDIWKTFRRITGSLMESREGRRRRLLLYCCYSWGLPLLLSLLTLALQYLPKGPLPRPGHGERMCYFRDYSAKLAYHHIPMTLLLLSNIAFFSRTIWSLFFGIWAANRNDVLQRRPQQSLAIVIWLFFITGVPWLADSITGTFGGTEYLAVFLIDTLNAFNGLIIFLLFIVKKSVVKAVREHFRLPGLNITNLVKPVSKVRSPVTEVSDTTSES